MSIILNGVTLGEYIEMDETDVDRVIFNGATVNPVKPANYDTYKSATSLNPTQWKDFVNSGCIHYAIAMQETTSFLNKIVILTNTESISGDGGEWYRIADFNHDGSKDTVDLITRNCYLAKHIFSNYTVIPYGQYSTSQLRDYLIGDYYNGYADDLKALIVEMPVECHTYEGTLYTLQDKVKILSMTECNVTSTEQFYLPEGSQYPIFTDDASRIIQYADTINNANWWLRAHLTDPDRIRQQAYIDTTGKLALISGTEQRDIITCLRFKKP